MRNKYCDCVKYRIKVCNREGKKEMNFTEITGRRKDGKKLKNFFENELNARSRTSSPFQDASLDAKIH